MRDEREIPAMRDRTTGVRDRKTGVRDRKTGVRDRKTGVRDRKAGVRDRKTGVRDRKVGTRQDHTVCALIRMVHTCANNAIPLAHTRRGRRLTGSTHSCSTTASQCSCPDSATRVK